jgi:uncharacterized protein YfbU (UPF0304 family)
MCAVPELRARKESRMGKKSQRQMDRERWIREEVREILAMFRTLKRSYEELPDKTGIDENLITFDGFDGNNEHEHLQAGQQIAGCTRGLDVHDSHMPRLRGYQMMLQAWKSTRDKENLTKEDLLRITRCQPDLH